MAFAFPHPGLVFQHLAVCPLSYFHSWPLMNDMLRGDMLQEDREAQKLKRIRGRIDDELQRKSSGQSLPHTFC